jgi:2,3-bisphosphoglycerate-dependent phosphoglycerate mutase
MRLYIIRHAQSENNAFYAGLGTFGRRVPDPPLTPAGHQQAEHLARRLVQPVPSIATGNEQAADFGLTHLYCSLMVRAIVTASYVAEALDLPLVAWPEIHEVGGVYDYDKAGDGEEKIGQPGNSRAFFATHYPHLLLPKSLGESGWWNRPAETREEMAGRAREFWNVLLERHGASEDRVALITHGGFFQGLMTTLVNPFSGEAPQLPPEEAAAAMSPAAVNQLSEDLPLPSHGIRRVWFDIQNTSITRIDFFDAEAVVVYHNRVDHLPVELIT